MAKRVEEEIVIQLQLKQMEKSIKDAEKLSKALNMTTVTKAVKASEDSFKKLNAQIASGAKFTGAMKKEYKSLETTLQNVFRLLGSTTAAQRSKLTSTQQNKLFNLGLNGLPDFSVRGGRRGAFRNPLGYGGDPAYVRALSRASGGFGRAGGLASIGARAGMASGSAIMAGGTAGLLAIAGAFAGAKGVGFDRARGALSARRSYRSLMEAAGAPMSATDLAQTDRALGYQAKLDALPEPMSDARYNKFQKANPNSAVMSGTQYEGRVSDILAKENTLRGGRAGWASLRDKEYTDLQARRRSDVTTISQIARGYGYTGDEGIQTVTRALSAGGGGNVAQITNAALAAQRLGIAPELIGSLASARLAAGQDVKGVTQQASQIRGFGQALNLGGAELKRYFESMVGYLSQLAAKGVQVDTSSVMRMQGALSSSMSGQMAVQATSGLVAMGQDLARNGPQSVEDVAKARYMYGMGSDFSSASIGAARLRASRGQVAEGGIENMLKWLETTRIAPTYQRGSAAWESSMLNAGRMGDMFNMGTEAFLSAIRRYGQGKGFTNTLEAGPNSDMNRQARAAAAAAPALQNEANRALTSQMTGEDSMASMQNWANVQEKFVAAAAGMANAVSIFDKAVQGFGGLMDSVSQNLGVPTYVSPQAMTPSR